MVNALDGLGVLVLDGTGRVVDVNGPARRALVRPFGRPCHEVVCARRGDGLVLCTAKCSAAMSTGRAGDIEHGLARVRGRLVRLSCSPTSRGATVVMQPAAIEAAADEVLSPREREVLVLVSEGLTAREIAERLAIGVSTVRTHVENARTKLGARTRAEAVARAVATGQLASVG